MSHFLLFDSFALTEITDQLCQTLVKHCGTFNNTILLGLQPKGVFLAERIQKKIHMLINKSVVLGKLDVTFFRDDFRKRNTPIQANTVEIPCTLDEKHVVLIDDVLYTGRMVRAALEAIQTYGRPASIELLVLVSRKNAREMPIEPTYVGRHVDITASQRVVVSLQEEGVKEDHVWLYEEGQQC